MALPDPRSLHTLYAFYAPSSVSFFKQRLEVYSHQDAPERSREGFSQLLIAHVRTLGQPFVQFHNLMCEPQESYSINLSCQWSV